MNIKSLHKDVLRKNGYYDLFKSTIRYNISGYEFSEYTVLEEDEMRLDLVLKKMYDLSPSDANSYLENLDIICTINNLDNPLNIKRGMILKYPENLGEFELYRIASEQDLQSRSKSITKQLSVPDKKTRTDSSRKKYVDSGYSLPPTVNSKPKNSVTIENGAFKIGGIG